MKEELGLDHFAGRSWTGLHRHTLLTMLALAFRQHLRLAERTASRGRGGKPSYTPRGAARARRPPHPRRTVPAVPLTARAVGRSSRVTPASPAGPSP